MLLLLAFATGHSGCRWSWKALVRKPFRLHALGCAPKDHCKLHLLRWRKCWSAASRPEAKVVAEQARLQEGLATESQTRPSEQENIDTDPTRYAEDAGVAKLDLASSAVSSSAADARTAETVPEPTSYEGLPPLREATEAKDALATEESCNPAAKAAAEECAAQETEPVQAERVEEAQPLMIVPLDKHAGQASEDTNVPLDVNTRLGEDAMVPKPTVQEVSPPSREATKAMEALVAEEYRLANEEAAKGPTDVEPETGVEAAQETEPVQAVGAEEAHPEEVMVPVDEHQAEEEDARAHGPQHDELVASSHIFVVALLVLAALLTMLTVAAWLCGRKGTYAGRAAAELAVMAEAETAEAGVAEETTVEVARVNEVGMETAGSPTAEAGTAEVGMVEVRMAAMAAMAAAEEEEAPMAGAATAEAAAQNQEAEVEAAEPEQAELVARDRGWPQVKGLTRAELKELADDNAYNVDPAVLCRRLSWADIPTEIQREAVEAGKQRWKELQRIGFIPPTTWAGMQQLNASTLNNARRKAEEECIWGWRDGAAHRAFGDCPPTRDRVQEAVRDIESHGGARASHPSKASMFSGAFIGGVPLLSTAAT